jgi:serine/threonine-protein kinase
MRPVPNESKIAAGSLLVGKYKVVREIGRGGMAAVYEAEHQQLGKKVAVKVLAAELSASSIVIERFFREARAAASVKSDHIVDIYDSGRLEDGRPFICMEMLDGESLYDRMARIRLIDPETTVRVITQCAKGLVKAHAAGIVHRDLKPENIFLTRSDDGGEEIAKILDFGLAKFYTPVKDEKTTRLTREGAVFGTPAYMSPEQVKGQGNVDHRADLWALGCMAFECLIGRPVWNTDQGVAMTFAAIATGPIPVPSDQRPELPKNFDKWFAKALQRDPEKRFQSAKELAEELAYAFGNSLQVFPQSDSHVDIERIPSILTPGTVPLELVPKNIREAAAKALALPTPLAMPLAGDPLPNLADELESGRLSTGPAPLQISAIPGAGISGVQLPASPPSSARAFQISAAEHPPIARNQSLITSSTQMQQPASPARIAISSLALLGGMFAAFFTWSNILRPQVLNPVVEAAATASGSASASPSASTDAPIADKPKWEQAVEDGQKLFSTGDPVGAVKRFQDAVAMGGGNTARAFADQVKAVGNLGGSCRMTAFGHPRIGVAGGIGRPSIASVDKGALVTWTDDHERSGHDHAYAVVVDDAARPLSIPRDLTPESDDVAHPTLVSSGGRVVLLYEDKSGTAPGIHARWIDGDGRIAGASLAVGASRAGSFWPAIEKAPDGFFVAWQDERDKEGDDIFLRKLSTSLDPVGPEIRLTDYASVGGRAVNARVPDVAVAGDALLVVYKLERDPSHTIVRMRIPLGDPSLAKGLDERSAKAAPAPPSPGKKGTSAAFGDRELGDVALVNEDKAPADAPTIGCGTEGCFIAWASEKGGSNAALLDPTQAKVLWRKKFSDKGTHPVLGVGTQGEVYVSFFEQGKVKMAKISRDGIGAASIVAKVTGDEPRPSLSSGRVAGEWLLAWQDQESNHAEAYVAKVSCR